MSMHLGSDLGCHNFLIVERCEAWPHPLFIKKGPSIKNIENDYLPVTPTRINKRTYRWVELRRRCTRRCNYSEIISYKGAHTTMILLDIMEETKSMIRGWLCVGQEAVFIAY